MNGYCSVWKSYILKWQHIPFCGLQRLVWCFIPRNACVECIDVFILEVCCCTAFEFSFSCHNILLLSQHCVLLAFVKNPNSLFWIRIFPYHFTKLIWLSIFQITSKLISHWISFPYYVRRNTNLPFKMTKIPCLLTHLFYHNCIYYFLHM